MPSPRSAQIVALLVITSFFFGVPAGAFQSPGKQKPDYSQEAIVIEQLSNGYRFERDGTGQREVSFRAKVQSDAGVQHLGQLVFAYSSANEKLDMDFVRSEERRVGKECRSVCAKC